MVILIMAEISNILEVTVDCCSGSMLNLGSHPDLINWVCSNIMSQLVYTTALRLI